MDSNDKRLRQVLDRYPSKSPTWMETATWVIQDIDQRLAQQLPLDATALTCGPHRQSCLYARGLKTFGTWRKAVEAAGLDYSKIARRAAPFATEAAVLAEIRARKAKGLPVNTKALRWSSDLRERSLFKAGEKRFGNWTNAVVAAGFQYAKLRGPRYPDEDAVVKAILARRQENMPLHTRALFKGPFRDWALYNKAVQLFAHWRTAVERAGLKYEEVCPPRYKSVREPLSADAVKEAILCRHRMGVPVHAGSLMRGSHVDWRLLHSARRAFGSWRSAVEAAGLPYESPARRFRYPEKQDVICAIQQRHRSGLPLSAHQVRCGPQKAHTLYDSAKRLFGGWQSAIEAAGLDYNGVAQFSIKYPDRQSVVEAIRQRARQDMPLSCNGLRRGANADEGLYMAIRRCWGGWEQALAAALEGCSSTEYPRLRYPSKLHVVREVEHRFKHNGVLLPENLRKGGSDDMALFVSGLRYFGTWEQVARAARIPWDMLIAGS